MVKMCRVGATREPGRREKIEGEGPLDLQSNALPLSYTPMDI